MKKLLLVLLCMMTVVVSGCGDKFAKEKEVMEKRLFGTPKLYEFEDTMLYGPELMPEYLEKMYGWITR